MGANKGILVGCFCFVLFGMEVSTLDSFKILHKIVLQKKMRGESVTLIDERK